MAQKLTHSRIKNSKKYFFEIRFAVKEPIKRRDCDERLRTPNGRASREGAGNRSAELTAEAFLHNALTHHLPAMLKSDQEQLLGFYASRLKCRSKLHYTHSLHSKFFTRFFDR